MPGKSSASVRRANVRECAAHQEKEEGASPLVFLYLSPDFHRKPIDGIGEPPMLMNGYANAKCWFSCMNLTLLSIWLWTDVCEIVGNAEANVEPQSALAVVGNETEAAWSSVATAVSFSNAVRVWSWTSVGNPKDIGTSAADAGTAIIATASDSITIDSNLLTMMFLPSSMTVIMYRQ